MRDSNRRGSNTKGSNRRSSNRKGSNKRTAGRSVTLLGQHIGTRGSGHAAVRSPAECDDISQFG